MVDHHVHDEVRLLLLGPQLRHLRGVGDLHHRSGKRRVRQRVHLHRGGLPDADRGDVGLVHVRLDLHATEIGDAQDHGARVVHGPDHHDLTALHVELGHRARDGRREDGLSQVVLRAQDRGAGARHFLAIHVRPRPFGIPLRARGLDLLGRDELPLEELLLPAEVGLGLLERDLREPETRFRRIERGLTLPQLRAVLGPVELEEELPFPHPVPFLDRDPDDLARDVGAELHVGLGLHLRGRPNRGRDVPLDDVVHLDALAAPLSLRHVRDHDRSDQDDPAPDQETAFQTRLHTLGYSLLPTNNAASPRRVPGPLPPHGRPRPPRRSSALPERDLPGR